MQPIVVHDFFYFSQQMVPGNQCFQIRNHNFFAGILLPVFLPITAFLPLYQKDLLKACH